MTLHQWNSIMNLISKTADVSKTVFFMNFTNYYKTFTNKWNWLDACEVEQLSKVSMIYNMSSLVNNNVHNTYLVLQFAITKNFFFDSDPQYVSGLKYLYGKLPWY